MSKKIRLSTGNLVQIIDSSSPHYKKKGNVVDIKYIPVTMISTASNPLNSHEEIIVTVKIDSENVDFETDQIDKVSQSL